MLEKEFQYYLDNQAKLVEQYSGKFLIIKDQEVIGVYESAEAAVSETTPVHTLGTFLVQYCDAGDASYTQHYHSRVVFA
ncbi:MAG: hypothetical protein V4619_15425 [Bacteroidota bacterium]